MTEPMTEVVLIGFVPADRERLGRLKQALETHGLGVDWWSVAPTRPNWINDLQRRIGAAPGVIVVWTAASAQDRWSAVAADEALERRRLISVLFDPVVPPRAFRDLVSLPMLDWGGAPESPEMNLLVESLTLMLGRPARRKAAPPVAPPVTPPASPRPQVPMPPLVQPPARADAPLLIPVQIHPIRGLPIQPVLPLGLRLPAAARQEPLDADPAARPPAAPSAPPAGPPAAAPAPVAPGRTDPDPGADLEQDLGFIPCIYGWALAWAAGVIAIGFYLLAHIPVAEVARVYIGNPLLSAAGGAAVGLLGAGFTLYALIRRRLGLSAAQLGLIALAWGLGGAGGLLVAAYGNLPVVGAVAGVVGFDFGWVLCWLIAGALGSLCTWGVLRRRRPFLDRRDLAYTSGGFALGTVGGWLLGWLVVALPILLLDWLLQALIPTGAAQHLARLLLELLSLGLIGAVGGAAFGLGGGLVLFGALGREAAAGDDGDAAQ